MLPKIHLRALLALTVLALTGSFVIVGSWQLYTLWQRQREIVDRQNIEFARAVSVAVEQSVENALAALSLLSSVDVLDTDELTRFRELARRAIPRQTGWHSVLLADASGRLRVNTASQRQSQEPVSTDWAQPVTATLRPYVSNLVTDAGVPGYFFTVAVPVVREGTLTHVLAVRIRTDSLSAIVHQQQIPPNGVVTLIDGNKLVMARSRGEREYVGKPPSAGFVRAASAMTEGSWREVLLEGIPAYAALSRSSLTGWTVGVGVPMTEIDAPMQRRLWLLGGVGLLTLLGGAGSATLFGRALIASLQAASRTADALVRGESTTPRRSRIVEVDALFAGLRRAESTLQVRLKERDDAERARAEAVLALEEALRAEQEARQQAEVANRAKDEFLMAVSHELRTPVTAIIGWSHMLQRGQLDEAIRPQAVQTIERNANVLKRLLDDLLDVSRYGAGKLRLDIRVVDPGAVIQAAIDAVQPSVTAKGLEIRADVAPIGPVLADGDRVQQVVWNLLANAVRFTPPGGHIDITLQQQGDGRVDITVSDTGPGIETDLLPFVFEPFRQGAKSVMRGGGLGLGLAIVRHLIELHGGTVRAENRPSGRGARFVVSLPPGSASSRPASTPLDTQVDAWNHHH